jgi:hypothetical protein
MRSGIIALLSDLGTRDYFVGAMKGVILSKNPEAKIVDITHEIRKFDLRAATFVLAQGAKNFPKGTVFVVVVDPGVGTPRKCILLRTKNGLNFIAPDNGVLTLVAQEFGIREIRELSNPKLMLPDVSATFHGRDVMAPVAAHLTLGVKPSEVGPRLKRMKLLPIERPTRIKGGLRGKAVHVDDFGNIITNIKWDSVSGFRLGDKLKLEIGKKSVVMRFTRTFGDASPGEFVFYRGSSGCMEIAKNLGNAAHELDDVLSTAFTKGFILRRLATSKL